MQSIHALLAFQPTELETAGDGLSDWIEAAISLGTAVVIASGARAAIRKLGRRRDTTSSAVQIMARLVFGFIVAVGAYVALQLIGVDLGPVLAGAGIAGVALAFALQDIAANYTAGILMGFRNPFVPGDQIVSGEHEGTVEQLDLRYTTIRTYDGVKVLLPNSEVLRQPISNLTTNGIRRTDFTIGVEYGTDLDAARRLVIEAVSKCAHVVSEPPVEAWVEELASSWIDIRVRYWHAPRTADLWRVRNDAIIAVYAASAKAGVTLGSERQIIEFAANTTSMLAGTGTARATDGETASTGHD